MDFSAFFNLATSGAGLFTGKFRKGGARAAWQTTAETHGLLHKPEAFWSGPKLSGLLSGNELTVDLKDRNTASVATRFRLAIPSLGLGLRLRKKGFWNSLKPRTLTGDRAFDNQVVVNGRNDLAVQEFLTPERRTVIQSFLSSFKGSVITDDEILLKTRGYVKDSGEMLGAIDAMMRVASVLSEPEPVAEPELPAEPEPVAEPQLQPEPEPTHAEEPEPEQTARPADEPDEPIEPVAEAMAPADRVTSKDAPGVEAFCSTVFAPGVPSFSADRIFKESYQGQRVVWTGTLESATPFSFDFDFGSGGGTKAVLTILESGGPGSRNVQAVIGLPPGTEGLDDRIGQPIAFAGRLLKVDGLAKRVLIANARLRP